MTNCHKLEHFWTQQIEINAYIVGIVVVLFGGIAARFADGFDAVRAGLAEYRAVT